MLATQPHDALALALDRLERLRRESAARRLHTDGARRLLATTLRRTADRLERTPLAPRPV